MADASPVLVPPVPDLNRLPTENHNMANPKTVTINGREFEITNPTWIESLTCPRCGAPECHPTKAKTIMIRGLKICDENGNWWSHCLFCSGAYDPVTLEYNGATSDGNKGWFVDDGGAG